MSDKQTDPLAPPEVADLLRTIELRAGYIIGACKDVREMRLEAEEIKRLTQRAFMGMAAWWHGQSTTPEEQDTVTLPKAPPERWFMPFIMCPADEVLLAWSAFLHIAAVGSKRSNIAPMPRVDETQPKISENK